MSRFIGIIVGGAQIVAGGILAATGVGVWAAPWLIMSGAGSLMSGLGTLFSKGPVTGWASASRNPVAPWPVIYGRASTGGTLVYLHSWGDDNKMLDLVVVVAAHSCESVDAVYFDKVRLQFDTSKAPAGAKAGSGTSFTPVQQKINIASIERSNQGVVTVTLNTNIPLLVEGDQLRISGVTGDATLNGTYQVAQILSQGEGTLRFTYLNGGLDVDFSGQGTVETLWPDFGRKVYFEWLDGTQELGETFKGMEGTPYAGDMRNIVNPDAVAGLGGNSSNAPNPWTDHCSLQGKTAVFLRLHYNDKYFRGGLPQISFIVHGKNDIYDPRTSPPTYGYTENAALCIADFLAHPIWGFRAAYDTQIPLPELIAAANLCDEPVPLALSTVSPPITEPAYTCNGQFRLSMKRSEVLRNMLTAGAARLTYVGGKFVIWPAAWTGNSFAIGSDPGGGVTALPAFEKIAAGPIRWRPKPAGRELYNGVKGTYISPANKWNASDFPAYAQDERHGYTHSPPIPEMDANLAADGGERRWLDVQLPFTISAATAQRIAKIELLRRRQMGSGTLIFNMVAYQITPLDLGLVTLPLFGWDEKQLEAAETRLRLEAPAEEGAGPVLLCEIDLQETAPEIYEWSTSEELSPQGYVQPAIPGLGSFDFFANFLVPGYSIPYPWSPGYASPLVGDALYPGPVLGSPLENRGRATFGMQVRYGTTLEGNPTANLDIKGAIPPTNLSSIHTPQISAEPGNSGNLPAGQYVLSASALDTGSPVRNTRVSVPIVVTIAEEDDGSGSIDVTVDWPPESNGGEIYMGKARLGGDDEAGYFYQTTLSSVETTLEITDFDQSQPGAPDPTCDHFAIAWKKVAHSGRWAAQVQTATADTVTLAVPGVTEDEYAGDTLTLLGKLDSTQELIVLNMPMASNTASSSPEGLVTFTIGPNSAGDQLPDLTTLLVTGDLLVMRYNPAFTATSFSDPKIANGYYPEGATDIEAGRQVVVLTGPDAGDVQTIASVGTDGFGNKTIFHLAAPWKVQPNDGDIVVVVEAGWSPEIHTQSLQTNGEEWVSGVAASPQVTNLAAQTWLFIVHTQTAANRNGADTFAPVREIYIFGSQGTRTIAESQEMLATDRIINADATAEPLIYDLLPFSQIPNRVLFIQKIDPSENTVTIRCAEGDAIEGEPEIVLYEEWHSAWIVIDG